MHLVETGSKVRDPCSFFLEVCFVRFLSVLRMGSQLERWWVFLQVHSIEFAGFYWRDWSTFCHRPHEPSRTGCSQSFNFDKLSKNVLHIWHLWMLEFDFFCYIWIGRCRESGSNGLDYFWNWNVTGVFDSPDFLFSSENFATQMISFALTDLNCCS